MDRMGYLSSPTAGTFPDGWLEKLMHVRGSCASAAWGPSLVGSAPIETRRLLFRWKNSNLYFPKAKAFILLQSVYGKQPARKNTNILVNYRPQVSFAVGQGE